MSLKCRTFPGGIVNDSVEETSTFISTNHVSIVGWINMGTIPSSNNFFLDGGSESISATTTGNLAFVANEWTSQTFSLQGIWSIPNPSISTWHHLAFIYSYSSTSIVPLIYLDSVSQTVTTVQVPQGTAAFSSRTWTMGNANQPDKRCFNGSLFGWARYGEILSASDVAALFAGAPPCSIQRPNLMLYYPLDNGESPEYELVHGDSGIVVGTTIGTAPAIPYNPRCIQRRRQFWQ